MGKISALKPFDPADYLADADAVVCYIEEAIEIGDPEFIIDAIGVIARAKGMTKIAKSSGLARESLYRALRKGGNPEFVTVLKVIAALGLQLKVVPLDGKDRTRTAHRRQKVKAA